MDGMLSQEEINALLAGANLDNFGSDSTLEKEELLTDEQKDIVAHFKNPAMPSVAVTADAAIKIASAREGFAGTDTFLEMIGFDKADIRRIKAQERMNMGLATAASLIE